MIGKTLTFSILLYDGELISGSWVFQNENKDIVVVDDYVLAYNVSYQFTIYSRVSAPRNIIAAKLELGTQQTLAHKENGKWVLNEIPKFGDQLAECLRYARKGHARFAFSKAVGNSRMYVPLSQIQPPMRTIPSYSYTDILSYSDGTPLTRLNYFDARPDLLPAMTIKEQIDDNVIQCDYFISADL